MSLRSLFLPIDSRPLDSLVTLRFHDVCSPYWQLYTFTATSYHIDYPLPINHWPNTDQPPQSTNVMSLFIEPIEPLTYPSLSDRMYLYSTLRGRGGGVILWEPPSPLYYPHDFTTLTTLPSGTTNQWLRIQQNDPFTYLTDDKYSHRKPNSHAPENHIVSYREVMCVSGTKGSRVGDIRV